MRRLDKNPVPSGGAAGEKDVSCLIEGERGTGGDVRSEDLRAGHHVQSLVPTVPIPTRVVHLPIFTGGKICPIVFEIAPRQRIRCLQLTLGDQSCHAIRLASVREEDQPLGSCKAVSAAVAAFDERVKQPGLKQIFYLSLS